MTPLETIRAINAACDKAHIDGIPVLLLTGKLWRTKWRSSAILWYAVDNCVYKFKEKTLLAARGELVKFVLGDTSARVTDVTEQQHAFIAKRWQAAKARHEQKALTYSEWADSVLAGQADNEGEAA